MAEVIVGISSSWTLDGYMNMVQGCELLHPHIRFPVDMADGAKRAACLRCIQRLGGPTVRVRHRMVLKARRIIRGEVPSPLFEGLLNVMDVLLRRFPLPVRDVIIGEACRRRRIEGIR